MNQLLRHGDFIREFVRAPKLIGAIAPSSAHLAKTMIQWIDWPNTLVVVEYGPGEGALTSAILASKGADTRFLTIELQPSMAEKLKHRFPTLETVVGSAADIRTICRDRGIESLDAVVCGLPWAAWDRPRQESILAGTLAMLKPGGQFTTFAYLQGLMLPGGRSFRRLLTERFAHVERSHVVWLNLPPAIAYRCRTREWAGNPAPAAAN